MQGIIDVDVDVFDNPFLEASDRRAQVVAPGRQSKNAVLTGRVTRHRPRVVCGHLNHGDGSVSEHRARFVADGTGDRPGDVCP